MSRYYDVMLFDPGTKQLIKRWTSHPNGAPASTWPDPGAQDMELDLTIADYAVPDKVNFVRIYGVSFADIGQSQNWNPNPTGQFSPAAQVTNAAPSNPAGGPSQPKPANAKMIGASIAVYGGMGKGLPLAVPDQAGLLISGTINEAFGNWQGTDLTLDLYVVAANVTGNQKANLSFHWPAGTPMATMITQTLNQAFPGYKIKMNISPDLVLTNDEPGFYGDLVSFSKYLHDISINILRNVVGYAGVRLWMGPNNTFIVDDGTSVSAPKQIAFTDLIGQPTWISTENINFTTVMRGDIQVGDIVELPKTMTTSTAGSVVSMRDQLAFQGTFFIRSVRTIGRFRNPNGASWISVYEASLI